MVEGGVGGVAVADGEAEVGGAGGAVFDAAVDP